MRDEVDITDDAILNGRLRLFQPKRGHRFGHDAILLAAAVPAQSGQRVGDFGAGVGAASLALLSRVPNLDATLFEIDETLCDLARENIARNGFADQARVVATDLSSTAPSMGADFDHVFMNPPFNDRSDADSPDPSRRRAHAGDTGLLQRWMARAAGLLSNAGTVTLIWRADGLNAALRALDGFGAISVMPIYPAPGRAAIRVIVSGRRDSRAALQVLPALVLNDADHRPTAEADSILRDGGAWPPQSP